MSNVRQYELVYIAPPETTEEVLADLHTQVAAVVERFGGTIEKTEAWGRRRLAYEIAKHAEGIYVVIDLKAAPATVSELDRQLSLNESVLRTKVMRTDKH